VIIGTSIAMVGIALVLLPLPDSCDEPGDLVLCSYRASAAGLMFDRDSPWPAAEALAALLLFALVGAGMIVRGRRRSRRRTDSR
jgi:hypothetical protein